MDLWRISAFLYLVSTVTVNCQTEVLMFIAHSGTYLYASKYSNGTILRCRVTQEVNCTALDIFTPNPRNPVYDNVGDHVYWTDSHLHAVCRVSSDGTNFEQWINDLNNIGGLTVDPIQRFGFLKANSSLLRFSLETKNITVVDSSQDSRDVAIDVKKRKLFSARSHGIEMMDYNGKQRELLVTTDDSRPKFCHYAEGDVLIYSNSDELISLDMTTRTLKVIHNNYYNGNFVAYQNIVYVRKKYRYTRIYRVLTNGTTLPGMNLKPRLSRPFSMTVFRKYDSVSRTSNGNVRCGHCYDNSLCDVKIGVCLGGCDLGWQGTMCLSACKTGRYGRNCEGRCGQCSGDLSCDPVSGVCSGGCRLGWTGRFCDLACSDGQYGSNCMQTCGHCYNDQACRKSDGTCEGGCDPGWTGNICKSACRSGRYGKLCVSSCGQCKVGTECEKTTGLCPKGCKPDWTGPKCDTKAENVHPKLDAIFGLLGIMMFGITLALFRLWFGRQCSRARTHQQSNEEIALVAHSNPEYKVGAGGERKGTSGADKDEDIYENERIALSKLKEEQKEEAVYETF